jgi:hypothetical protein
VAVLVATGSELTWLPKDVLAKTGIPPQRKRTFAMANKQIIEREVGYAILAAEGYETTRHCKTVSPITVMSCLPKASRSSTVGRRPSF